jgi:hypothetical protein
MPFKYKSAFLLSCLVFMLLVVSVNPASAQSAAPYPASAVIASITWDWSTLAQTAEGSDLWPVTWADDGNLYASWGDGGGFGGTNSNGRVGMGFARLEGPAESYLGVNVNGGKSPENLASFPNSGKTVGLLSVDGTLYSWVNTQNSNPPDVKLAWSTDYGATWQLSSWRFASSTFAPSTFLNFGKGYAGARDGFVYFYGGKWGSNSKDLYLGRVVKGQVKDPNACECFTGLDASGSPTWSHDVGSRRPVFTDPNSVEFNGALKTQAVFNPGINRYLLTVFHGGPGMLGVFDGPEPWGPWATVVYVNDFGGMTSGGEGLSSSFPTKWISADGLTMWNVFSVYGSGAQRGIFGHDRFNLVKTTLALKKGVPSNQPPRADAGADVTIGLFASATLDGTVSDDGPPSGQLSVQWSKVSGPGSVTFADARAVDTTATFSASGTYVLRLTADDGALTASDDVTVIVSTVNAAPKVEAGQAQSVTLASPATALLDGSVSDDGLPSGRLSVQWSKVSGPDSVTFGDASVVDTAATFLEAGTYLLRLTADDGDLTTSDDVTIAVNPANQAPAVDAGPDVTISLSAGASLDGTVSDDGLPSGQLSVQWSKVSGPGSVTFAASGAVDTTVTFTEAGTYVLRLSANDSDLTANDDVTITVGPNNPPQELEVSILNVASGKPYEAVKDGLVAGAQLYLDRAYTFTTLPADLAGSTYIKTANEDKRNTQADFLTLSVNQDVTV